MPDDTVLQAYVRYPGARYRHQGPSSGEQFRDDNLMPALEEARQKGGRLRVLLTGAEFGYPVGWLEEAFGGLARAIPDLDAGEIVIESTEYPEEAQEARAFLTEALATASGTSA